MTTDALDPGPDGDYPYWPRNADGSPNLDRAADDTDGIPTRMPTGLHRQRMPDGTVVTVDLTPRHPDGTPIVPPTIAPGA